MSTDEQTLKMEYPVSKVISFTEYGDTIRRGGVASVIKSASCYSPPANDSPRANRNCSFHPPAHRALLSPEDVDVPVSPSTTSAPGVNVLPAVLLPLAGPEELDLEVSGAIVHRCFRVVTSMNDVGSRKHAGNVTVLASNKAARA